MNELIDMETVSDGRSIESPHSSLVFSEVPHRYLWSIQPGREESLDSFSQAIFARATGFGEVLQKNSLCLLKLWPHKAWLLSASPPLPSELQDYTAIVTDISHGFYEFRMQGEQALDFLGSYTSTDPVEQDKAARRSLHCLLGQYPVVLWWQESTDIRLLVERSLALSFYDYITNLMVLWSPQPQ